MHRPMAGARVTEVAQFNFVPASGGVLADRGADVIEVEHVSLELPLVVIDIQRGGPSTGLPSCEWPAPTSRRRRTGWPTRYEARAPTQSVDGV